MKRYTGIVGVFAFVFGLLWVSEPEPAAAQISLSRGGEVIQIATGSLTATQVRKLNNTPIEVIAAPGSGKVIVLESQQYMLDWNSVAYDSVAGGEDLLLQYTTANTRAGLGTCDNVTCFAPGGTADAFGNGVHGIESPTLRQTDNQGVEITVLNGEWATTDDDSDGDSPIRYRIRYRIVVLDLS